MRTEWLSAKSSRRSLIFHDGSFIGSTQFAPRKETSVNAANERECSQLTLVYAANERECSQSSCNADCGDEAVVKAAENCSVMATLRAWKWWRQLGTPVIATFRNDRICFHGGGRDVYDGLSLNQHCCSKTSTGEATYSKIKGLATTRHPGFRQATSRIRKTTPQVWRKHHVNPYGFYPFRHTKRKSP